MTVKFERIELFVVTTETREGVEGLIRKTYTFIDPATNRVLFDFDVSRSPNYNPTERKIADMVGRP